ncbi:MAG: hypothetical protein K8W52_38965 [Deltaproteobacteria bacterium]|nr:hypothetical protein [Deltaproteobacteria bacterium]
MTTRLLIIGLCAGLATRAVAEGCPADAAARAASIRAHLDHEAHKAHRWDLGWGLGLGAVAVAQGAMGAARWYPGRDVDDKVQAGLYIGAGKAVLGALPHVILPLKITRPGPPTSDACADLVAASAALVKTAHEERQVFWLNIAGSVALAGGGLLIAGYGYDAWREGVVGALIGLPVGALITITQPRASWRAHGRGDFEVAGGAVTLRLDAVQSAGFTGLVVHGMF